MMVKCWFIMANHASSFLHTDEQKETLRCTEVIKEQGEEPKTTAVLGSREYLDVQPGLVPWDLTVVIHLIRWLIIP